MSGINTNGMTQATFPLTGSELIPADTQLTAGLNPETESVSVSQIKGFERPPVALTDAATISTDASLASLFTVTLAGNRTLANPSNLQSGGTYRFEVNQDATGARTLTYGNKFKFSGSSTLTTTASAIDMLSCSYDGTSLLCTLATKFA